MISGIAARYVFAACLAASVVDLLVVDLVIGPLALREEPGAAASAAVAPASATTTTTPSPSPSPSPSTTPTPSASPTTTPSPTTKRRSRVVARFDSDQPAATEDDLKALAAEMLADPAAEIVLEGHADQRGDPEKNRLLSLGRATWAQARLVELGVSASRIALVGIGAERPIETGDDDAAVASNRRVEVRWISGSPSHDDGDR